MSALEQADLPLARRAKQVDLPMEVVAAKKDFMSAINLCIDMSGLDDKEIQVTLEIDAGHWSNIRKCKPGAHFPPNKLEQLMDLCGNEIPLQWLANKRGKGLHMLETEAQRLLREERDAHARSQEEIRILRSVIEGRPR